VTTPAPPETRADLVGRRVLGLAGLTIVCSSALFISSLDVTVVNVALPTLRAHLSAGPAHATGCGVPPEPASAGTPWMS
jgi:hypothetical protein